MTRSLEQLVAALREELQQYGEMLALLDRQQTLVAQRAATELLQSVSDINAQTDVLGVARQQREVAQRAVARELKLPEDATLVELIRRIPTPLGALVQALLDENNTCLLRVKQRAGQNRLLLSRSVELMQRLLNTLLVEAQTPVYNGNGSMALSPVKGAALCNAVG
jgi:flagellar biosynthesis/type III secretory pathway chaperone